MVDLIDRQALRLMKTEECAGHSIEYAMGWKACIEWIRALPSAWPEQRWIPVSERLPNFAQCVLVSTANFVYEAIYFDEDAGWSTYNVTFKDVEESEILAWMPLPAKYREED